MVDYNIAVPQQQLFQAPDFTQNAMRMQQAQLQEMQMQELARKNAAARNTQQLYADPNFDQFSPEGIRRLAQTGGYEAGIAAANAARQIEDLQRRTALTNAGLEKTRLEIGAAQYDIAQNRLAAIPPGDAKGYAEWDRVHGPAYRANGVSLPTPEQWAQDPTGRLQGHMVSTSQSVRERAAKREEAGRFRVQMTEAGPMATNDLGQFRMATELRDGAPMGGGAGAPAVGGAPMGGAGAPAMPGAGAAPAGFDMDRAKQAIAGIESGGRYGALGPVTDRGDRAFGKYQVMGANIPSWTKEALGRSMTPAEFLASPEAQERVFETQFGKSVAKYGNPVDAASVWFSGRPLAKAGNASDVLGTTVPQYAQKFMAAYEGGANAPAMMRAPGFASSSGIPANVGLPVAPVMNALAGPQPPQQGNALAMQAAPMTQLQAAPMLQQQPAPEITAPQPAPAPTTFEEMQRTANARNLEKQRAIETMKAQVAAEAPPRAMTAQQERFMLNTVSKDRLSAETTIGTMDDVLKAVKDVQDLTPKQKESVTGITAKLPPVFADSRTARTKLDNLKGVVTQMGKRVASLGGAIGSMAVAEWKIVSDAIASLDTTNMNPKDLNDQLDIIAAKANAAAARTKDAYERQYEELKTKHGTRFDLSGGAAATTAKVPAIGATDSGYRFKGGDPAKADSWEKI